MRTVFLTVSGMSPAIITETLWALACEKPATVPDEVIVITTLRGEVDIQRQLLDPESGWVGKSVWETLRADVFRKARHPAKSTGLQLSVRVIDLPGESGVREKASDIRSGAENNEAADFILNALAPHVLAEDCRVIASIAGGRKTMGALLYGAMSLVAKETDRLTHVLVSEPFDMCRGFFYPQQPAGNLQAGPPGKPVEVKAADAVVELADIPFVPLRNGFRELGEGGMTFHGLVRRYSKELTRSRPEKPVVSLDSGQGTFTVEGKPIKLTGRELLVCMFLCSQLSAGRMPYHCVADAQEDFESFFGEIRAATPRHRAISGFHGSIEPDTLTKGLSSLRTKLKAGNLAHTMDFLAPVRGKVGFDAVMEPS